MNVSVDVCACMYVRVWLCMYVYISVCVSEMEGYLNICTFSYKCAYMCINVLIMCKCLGSVCMCVYVYKSFTVYLCIYKCISVSEV